MDGFIEVLMAQRNWSSMLLSEVKWGGGGVWVGGGMGDRIEQKECFYHL